MFENSKGRLLQPTKSVALRADAAESALCAYLSPIALAGLVIASLWRVRCADPMAALAIMSFVVWEGRCQASTCFRMGSKLRCIQSTPTETQSIKENDFECLASTGVNAPLMAMTADNRPKTAHSWISFL